MQGARIFADDAPVAFVDIETTGGQSAYHRITEIAVVGAHGDVLDFEWSTLVNPGVAIPPSITVLTGIDNDMVRDAPPFERVAGELRERLAGRLFVAHNVRFDYNFIRGEFQRCGARWQSPSACTARLSRKLFPQEPRHNLDSLIARHGLDCPVRHRAMPDAQALWQFWRMLRAEFAHDALDATLADVSRTCILPPQLPADLGDQLPEQSGVYRFFGAGDALIYVGKANNLRERVLGHFGGAHRDAKSKRLSEQTLRIEWTTTAGELGALLLEALQVRERKPVYNRRLRGAAVWSWQWPDHADSPAIVSQPDGANSSAACFGQFKSAREAQRALRSLAEEQSLCLKLLGLETGAGSCFAYQLKRCRGVCVGAEPVNIHALRARLAMSRWKLRDWPYPGAIAVVERGVDGSAEAHVLDAWRHLATLRIAPSDEALDRGELMRRCRRVLDSGAARDYHGDVYRILASCLRSPDASREIWRLDGSNDR